MARKYLKKYNETTGKWEIMSPTSTDDISVSNTKFNNEEAPISILTDVLNDIGSDIDRLKRNVSWLAEHGGGGGGVGIGGGNGSNYKIVIMNAGITNDTLYVNDSSFSVTFKITGGGINDMVDYRVTYDGTYIVSKFTKTKVNTNISIDIPNIEMYSKVTPHTLIIEAVDPDGMTIPAYTLSIFEASIKATCAISNVLTIGKEGIFNLFITNKILNTQTNIKVINTSFDNLEYTYDYISNSTAETNIPIDFYRYLIDESLVKVGNTYSLKIEVQTVTSEGTVINATPIYTTIMIQGSNQIVINLSSLTTEDAFNADKDSGSEFAVGGNINFGFTPYLIDNITTYYAIRLEYYVEGGSTENVKKIDIAGFYDLYDYENGIPKVYTDNPTCSTGKLRSVSYNIPNDEQYVGEWLVRIKCWSSSGLIENSVIGKCRIIPSNTEVFPTQIPIRGNISIVGNTQYAYWDVTNIPANDSKSKTWVSDIVNYLPPEATNEEDTTSVKTVMEVYNTNGDENGFLNSPSMRLRLSSESYAKIETDINNTWVTRDGFTISLTFKSDFHPYNDRTIFFLGKVDNNNEFYDGIKIDLENIYWYFTSISNNGANVSHRMIAPIRQNSLNTVDFVYSHKENSDGSHEGMAKIFINGKIYSAVEAPQYDSDLVNTIYLGCCKKNNGEVFNHSDVEITSLRLFSKALNDMEVVINSHNARAERDEHHNIIFDKYDEWKKRNYFVATQDGKPSSSIYKMVENNYMYTCPGYVDLKGSNPPIPILWLDGSQSTFTRDKYESTNNDASIIKNIYNNFRMYYYDPHANNGKGKEVQLDEGVEISIQGTSTTTYKSKNLELYFTKELQGYNDGRTQLFQPRDDWFPEKRFTLKADVVDSSHANNATLGYWINTVAGGKMEGIPGILEDTPPMKAVKDNPPKDIIHDNNGNEIVFENKQTLPTVKHTLEGFQIILMITFGQETKPEMLGIYSFNLGRYSYYNMGLNFFKSFSRRTFNELNNEWEEQSAPALVNHYDFYQTDETFGGIKMNEIFSFEFGSDADENSSSHRLWSQDDISVLKHIGEFKYNGLNMDDSQPADSVWNTLKRIFYATARMPDGQSKKYTYNGGYIDTGEEYTADLNIASELLNKRLSIKNTMAYFVIANAFGMVDSLGKNFTLRSWNAKFNDESDDELNINKWYPCFYDMDTALGLTNAGSESVPTTVFIDAYKNTEIDEDNIRPNVLKIERNAKQNNSFGLYNGKLWDILRSTAPNGSPNDFVSSGKYSGDYYEGTWRKLRSPGCSLSTQDNFINLLISQTEGCGELLYNLDYTVKYLTKYKVHLDDGGFIVTYGNIEMLHGDRVEYIRSWLKDRFNFLDGVFEVSNVTDNLPYYTKGTIVCGGPENSEYPIFTFNATSPTILLMEVGSNGEVKKYFLPAYKDTRIIAPALSSDSKGININSTTILTKIGGLKDARFQRFRNMMLPKFSELDLSNVTTLSAEDNPVSFETIFITNENGKNTSNVRHINLNNAKGSNSFALTVNDYNKLKTVDISKSCVTSISLPTTPLSSLLFNDSEIVNLTVSKQPYLSNFNFTGCNKLQKIELNECNNVETLNIENMMLLNSLTITSCEKLTTIICRNNKELTKLVLESLPNLQTVILTDCNNQALNISIKACNNITTIDLENVTSSNILLPINVDKVTTLNLTNCINLTGFKYGDNNSEINKYNNEDVLDLRNFTSLLGSGLKLKNCSSLKYVKFNNEENKAFILASNFFSGCNSLINVFGHISLEGTGIFNGCTQYFINTLPTSEITPLPKIEYKITDNVNDGNVTNIDIKTGSLDSMFKKTNCNLYDLYYILLKCNTVTNLSSSFYECKNIKTSLKNGLKQEAFINCGNVTSMDSMFHSCSGITTVLKSPTFNDDGTIKTSGFLTYLPKLTSFQTVFYNCKIYIDDKFFAVPGKDQNLLITYISYFSPTIIADSNDSKLSECDTESIKNYYAFASSSNLLTNLKRLTTISNSFNNSKYEFKDNKSVKLEDKNYYYTDLFYNNTLLTKITNSFNSINAKGNLRNLFGGYKATVTDNNHFPNSLTTIANSFNIKNSETKVNLYIGNSFLQKVKNTIQYITGAQTGQNTTYDSPSFSGEGLIKYIDNEGGENVIFPYKVFSGCSALKEAPAFFRNLKRTSEQSNAFQSSIITLPLYVDEYGAEKSMFEDTKNLTNISYMFSNMSDIKYTLKGGGFKNCKLVNVNSVFAEDQKNNLEKGNKSGCIPYGLFLQETEKDFTTVSGLTEADAESLGINDETYGIINCVFDSNGKVIVEFDEESGKLISGGTYADGVKINKHIDEYGVICDGTGESEDISLGDEDIICPLPEAKSKHSGKYKTHNTTITNISKFMEYSSSTEMSPYEYDIQSADIAYDTTTKKYLCPDLVVDNESYNPIKYFINPNFDPILKIWNDDEKVYKINDKYDPRRVILNNNYNKYKKKWNKWVADGSDIINKITGSTLYQQIRENVVTELPLDLPKELGNGYIPENTALPTDLSYNDKRFETRLYICPPDLFKYCKNDGNTNVTYALQYCGGPDDAREEYGPADHIRFGIYGVIPPYLFEPISEVTDLSYLFYNTKGILPYRWADELTEGLMYHPDLFKSMRKLKNITGLFGYTRIYNGCKIDATQFINNENLQNISFLFQNVIWSTQDGEEQIPNSLFRYNKNITNVSYMFYTSDTIGKNRLPRIMSSDLFTYTNNPKINNCSYFMYNGEKTSGSVPEFWNPGFSNMKYITSCYKFVANSETGTNSNITNFDRIEDKYKL